MAEEKKVETIGKDISEFIIDQEQIIEENAIKTEPLSDEDIQRMNQEFKDYETWLAENRQREAEEHKRNYIDALIVPGDVEATLRKFAEAIYNLDMGKAERPIYLR